MPLLFALTLFVSATLLFLVQPMIGKMILPALGGSPTVWNTCMVFFQATLLAGYLYAYLTTTWLGLRRQAILQVLLLLLAIVVLPINAAQKAKDFVQPEASNPIPWMLAVLLVTGGLPFFMLSTSAPLLQKWFAGTGHPAGKDPYFLYGASNLGSMLALVLYPLVIEPNTALMTQSQMWAVGYGLLVLLTVACAVCVWCSPEVTAEAAEPVETAIKEAPSTAVTARKPAKGAAAVAVPEPASELVSAPTWLLRLRWIALAFVPSSLMLGVTTYMTTDIAAIPLLWIIPLALYLLSFILVFSPLSSLVVWIISLLSGETVPRLRLLRQMPELRHRLMVVVMPLLVILLMLPQLAGYRLPYLGLTLGLHLLGLFVVAMVCHGELARTRPATRYLTEFYLWMSLGGVLGGLFNALVAPLIFKTIMEYTLALILACLLLPRLRSEGDDWLPAPLAQLRPGTKLLANLGIDMVWSLAVAGFTLLLVRKLPESGFDPSRLSSLLDTSKHLATQVVIYALPLGLAYVSYLASDRPVRLGLGVAAVVVIAQASSIDSAILLQDRGFFGTLVVSERSYGRDQRELYHFFYHGTTLHGVQIYYPEKRRADPVGYFHPTSPIGQVFESFRTQPHRKHIGVCGLGTGMMAAFGQKGQQWTYFEIDPKVVALAENPRYFTFLQDARKRGVDLPPPILGDGRLMVERSPHKFDLLLLDAFSSDAIPVHLLTREAIEQVYLPHLADDGILGFHITNRYLDLEPVLANLADSLGLEAMIQTVGKRDDDTMYRLGTVWVILARNRAAFGPLGDDPRWQPLQRRPEVGIWTDDYSNLLKIFDWGHW